MKQTRCKKKLVNLFMVLVLVLTMSVGNITYAATTKVKVKSVSVKTTGTTLPEGQKLTKTLVSKCIKTTVKYNNGKTNRNYTKYTINNSGKTIKPNNKGYYKVTLVAGSVKKAVNIKVNKIKKIYVKKTTQKALKEGSKFNAAAFKKATTVYADYTKGADKKLTTYTVSAPAVVKANRKGKFVVTLKYGNKKTTYSIPVKKNTSTTEKPTTEASTTEKPGTEAPTTEASTTEKPTTEAPTTEAPTTPDQPSAGEITTPKRPAEPIKVYFYDKLYKIYPEYSNVQIYIGIDSPEDCLNVDPKYYTNIDVGYLYTTENLDEKAMVLGGSPTNVKVDYSMHIRSTLYEPILDISEELWSSSTTVKVRGYAIVTNVEGTTEIIYSDILTFNLTDPVEEY